MFVIVETFRVHSLFMISQERNLSDPYIATKCNLLASGERQREVCGIRRLIPGKLASRGILGTVLEEFVLCSFFRKVSIPSPIMLRVGSSVRWGEKEAAVVKVAVTRHGVRDLEVAKRVVGRV